MRTTRRRRDRRDGPGLLHRVIHKPTPWQPPPRLPQAVLPRGPLLVSLELCQLLSQDNLFDDFINRRLWQASVVYMTLSGLKEKQHSNRKAHSLKYLLLTESVFTDVVIWASPRTYRLLAAQDAYVRSHLAILEDEHRRLFGRQLDGHRVRYFLALDERLNDAADNIPMLRVQFGETICLPSSDDSTLILKARGADEHPWYTCQAISGIDVNGPRQLHSTVAPGQAHILLQSSKRAGYAQGLLCFADWPLDDSDWLYISINPQTNKINYMQSATGPLDFSTDIYEATVKLHHCATRFYLASDARSEGLNESGYRLGYLEFAGFAIPRLEQTKYQQNKIASWQLYLDPELKGLRLVERKRTDLIDNARSAYFCIIVTQEQDQGYGMLYSDCYPQGLRFALHPAYPTLVSETNQLVLHPLHRTLRHHSSVLLAKGFAALGRWRLESGQAQRIDIELDKLPGAEVYLDKEHIPVAPTVPTPRLSFVKNDLDDWFIKAQENTTQMVLKPDLSERPRGESGVYVDHGDYIVIDNYVFHLFFHEP